MYFIKTEYIIESLYGVLYQMQQNNSNISFTGVIKFVSDPLYVIFGFSRRGVSVMVSLSSTIFQTMGHETLAPRCNKQIQGK
jgi:hypothetical protein